MSGDVFTGNGLMITDDAGIDQQGAGTSLSAPLWLGIWTRIQAAAREVGRPEDDLGSGFAGMDEEVLRPGATDEQRQYNRRRVTPHHRHEALS